MNLEGADNPDLLRELENALCESEFPPADFDLDTGDGPELVASDAYGPEIVPCRQESAEPHLSLLREALGRQAYPGYPEQADRLVMDPAQMERDQDGRLVLPDGPWNVDQHDRQPRPEPQPSPERQRQLLDEGYTLDSRGRPLHPWFFEMVADPSIGVALGKGEMWEWGAGWTVDIGVIKNDHILLGRRVDTDEWALPGGFVEPGETGFMAALRELREETGLVLDETVTPVSIHKGPVADIRATAHAWPETEDFLFDLGNDGPLPEVRGQDDVCEAAWVPLSSLGAIPLFGSHAFLIERSLEGLGRRRAEAERNQAVTTMASAFHEDWRQTRLQADGSYEPRLEQTGDASWVAARGTDQVDIANTAYADLPADWQAENRLAAEVVADLMAEAGGAVDLADPIQRSYIGNRIHNAWLARNAWAQDGELGQPFDRLPAAEQAKDINQVVIALELYRR